MITFRCYKTRISKFIGYIILEQAIILEEAEQQSEKRLPNYFQYFPALELLDIKAITL